MNGTSEQVLATESLDEDEQSDFRGALQEYVRKYAFLSQLLPFDDAELERLYLFARYLKRYLPVDRESACRHSRARPARAAWFSGGFLRPGAERAPESFHVREIQ